MAKTASKRSKKAKAKKPARSAQKAKVDWRDIRLTTDEAGAAVKVGGERIRQLTKDGWITKIAHNEYRLGDVIEGYAAFQADVHAKATADSEQAKLAASRRREVDMRIARDEGRLLEADDVQAVITEIISAFVAELRGVPAGSTRDLTVRASIEEILNGAIDRCRARFEKLGADLRSGRGLVFDDEETNA